MPNASDKIYAIICDTAGDRKAVRMNAIMDRCTAKGYKPDQVEKCIDEYEKLNVWQVNQTRTNVTFI